MRDLANDGVNRLMRAFDARIKDYQNIPPILDFGEIQGDMMSAD